MGKLTGEVCLTMDKLLEEALPDVFATEVNLFLKCIFVGTNLQDYLDQCPMPINADQNDGKCFSKPIIADQLLSMPDQGISKISTLGSMPEFRSALGIDGGSSAI